MLTALPAPTADERVPCPQCGYDLRAAAAGPCPECGQAVDPAALAAEADIPWQHRARLGRVRGLTRTVRLALRHPVRLARQAGRPVDYHSARRFHLLCVTLAWLALALPGAAGLWWTLRVGSTAMAGALTFNLWDLDSLPFWPRSLWAWFADGSIVLVAAAGLFAWLYTASAVPSYFFHPRHLTPRQQDRAIALSYYAAAPLALVPITVAILIAFLFALGILEGSGAVVPDAVGGVAVLVWMGIIAALWAWTVALPLVLLVKGLEAQMGRLALCATTTLAAWPTLFVLFALLPPTLVFYAQLVWHALG